MCSGLPTVFSVMIILYFNNILLFTVKELKNKSWILLSYFFLVFSVYNSLVVGTKS